MSPWRMQAVLNLYSCSNESIRHFSETHRTDRTPFSLSIGSSRTFDIFPVQYLAPRQGKKKGLIKLTKLREEEEAEAAQPEAEAEVLDEGAASRKRKLDELEQKKKALEAENAKKQKEIEDEAKRILAVEEAERRAKEQRAKNPKLQVPVAAEKSEKPETWFERKSAELVESFIQGCTPQQKRAREAEAAYADACRGAENAQASFIEALQQAQNCAEQLQTRMAQAL